MQRHAPAFTPVIPAPMWRGLGASTGVASGRAHVLRTERDLAGVADGSVLVLRHPTATILPALVQARAAVCETGGVLNHLAVLARELGKPCVTGVTGLVETLTPGAHLRVDGASGGVWLLTDGSGGPMRFPPGASAGAGGLTAPSPESSAGADAAMVPVLRFGRFSAAFERVDGSLDLETAVRIAALLSVPEAFTVDAPWSFALEAGRVLVPVAALRRTTDDLVGQIERGVLAAAALNARYRAGCAWSGWTVVARGTALADQLGEALCRFVDLNRLTWLASAARDPLVERYRALLRRALAPPDSVEGDRLFLESLVMSGRSYTGCRPAAGTAGEASVRRRAAVDQMRRRLGGRDFARATAYLGALDDLVDLTERKNTDLARCAHALFGGAANRRAIAAALGLDGAGDAEVLAEAAQRALIEAVLAGLRAGCFGTEGGNR